MSRTSVQRQSADVLRAADDELDLRIDLRVDGTNEFLVAAGGEWSCEIFDYVGAGGRARVLHVTPAQLEAARWWAGWLPAWRQGIANRPSKYKKWSILLGGGRRGGKTKLGTWLCTQFAAGIIDAVVWIVSPNDQKAFEVRRYIEEIVPEEWAKWVENAETGEPHYAFVNGAKIFVVSGYKPESTKMGEAHLVFINEGQMIDERVYQHARGAIADTGGLVIVAANPPDTVAGQWIDEFKVQAQAGRREAMYFEFDTELNRHVVQAALDDMRLEMDEDTYLRERKGAWIPVKDRVFYSFSDNEHVWPVAQDPRDRRLEAGARRILRDITPEFTERFFGTRFTDIAGVDFQIQPMAAVIRRAFEDPDDPRDVLMWTVNEILVDPGDENALLDEFARQGYTPQTLVSIGDASAAWQNVKRDEGPPSFGFFRSRGWPIYKPDDEYEKNPDVEERAKAANWRLREYPSGKIREYVDPSCVNTIRALKRWPRKNGLVHKRHHFSHVGDAWNYPIWRFWPRRVKDQGDSKYIGLPDAKPGASVRRTFGGY